MVRVLRLLRHDVRHLKLVKGGAGGKGEKGKRIVGEEGESKIGDRGGGGKLNCLVSDSNFSKKALGDTFNFFSNSVQEILLGPKLNYQCNVS